MALKPIESMSIVGVWRCAYCKKAHFSKDKAYHCCSNENIETCRYTIDEDEE